MAETTPAARTDTRGNLVRNIILNAIPEEEFRILRPRLEHVALGVGRTLHQPEKGIDFCYFLNTGLVSLVVETRTGKTVEVGVSGYEGMTGVALLGGLRRTTHRALIEVAGEGFRAKANIVREILASASRLRDIASRFAAVQAMQVAQTAACNRLHQVSQRMARWLLMTNDRVQAESLSVTHDFLSMMMGTDRPSVTEAAKFFQDRGAIRYSRGKLTILNRNKLKKSVCECYEAIYQFDRELGIGRDHDHLS